MRRIKWSRFPEWWPDWRGQTIVIVGSGPSAGSVPLALGRGHFRYIVINNSWQLAPWADILLACDFKWWKHYNGCPQFPGTKLATHYHAWTQIPGVQKLQMHRGEHLVLEEPGIVGWGGGSGFQAFNLAVTLEPERILLVGYDMNITAGLHWHGKHERGLGNPSNSKTARWRRALDDAAKTVRALGIEVVNCSATSSLRNYRKAEFIDVMRELGLVEVQGIADAAEVEPARP